MQAGPHLIKFSIIMHTYTHQSEALCIHVHCCYACFHFYFYKGATALRSAYFGPGTGYIYMDNVACTGSESQLRLCTHITSHDCGHSEDASVRCQPGINGYALPVYVYTYLAYCIIAAEKLIQPAILDDSLDYVTYVQIWSLPCVDFTW